jgi:hypothetical protein
MSRSEGRSVACLRIALHVFDVRKEGVELTTIERKIEGGICVTGRQERIRKQLLDDFKKRTDYCKLKE